MIPATDAGARPTVTQSIQSAAARTGVGFDFLMRTAMRESSLDPEAKASTSSATGLYQFIEQTWLGMVDRHGEEHGLGAYADAITRNSEGRYVVADRAVRQEILALRKDAEMSAVMAGELAQENRDILESKLGRPVTDGEVYAAHFLGPHGAVKLIRAAEANPEGLAASEFASAARANRAIFYERSGEARTLAQVYANVTKLPDSGVGEVPETDVPELLFAGLRGSEPLAEEGLGGGISAVYTTAPGQALVLTPGVIEILASLNPLPSREQARAI